MTLEVRDKGGREGEREGERERNKEFVSKQIPK
jgi:hypothetical protein